MLIYLPFDVDEMQRRNKDFMVRLLQRYRTEIEQNLVLEEEWRNEPVMSRMDCSASKYVANVYPKLVTRVTWNL